MTNKKSVRYFLSFVLVLILSFITIPQIFSQSNLGDTNGDTITDIVDALLVAQYYVGLNPDNFNPKTADVNGDLTIDIVDALLIAQFYVGLISEFPGQGDIIIIGSEIERNMNPQPEQNEIASIVEGNNLFAFDCYNTIKEQDGNIFFSPISISYTFGICFAGANGNTETQIASAMHFALPEERLHNAFNSLDITLTSEPPSPSEYAGDELKLHIANSTWGQQNYYFMPLFLDILSYHYGASMNTLDFMANPENCRLLINDWVSEETENKINDLLPSGSISPATRLVLTNAIYFKANWLDHFEVKDTTDGLFYPLDGGNVPASLMFQITKTPYCEVAGEYKAVKLPYQGVKHNSMIIILPADGEFEAFENSIDLNKLTEIKANMTHRQVHLTLPKFSYEWGGALNQSLKDRGMTDAFSPGLADFSGINGAYDLYISSVIHKSFIAVDEKGTEASAATAIVFDTTSIPDEATMTIDRPFLFFIINDDTGTILFFGRVLSM